MLKKRLSYTAITHKHLENLLPEFLSFMDKQQQVSPKELIEGWREVVGEKVASMTEAVSFAHGVLSVKVSNSSLLTLLVQREQGRLLSELKKKYPKHQLSRLRFYMG